MTPSDGGGERPNGERAADAPLAPPLLTPHPCTERPELGSAQAKTGCEKQTGAREQGQSRGGLQERELALRTGQGEPLRRHSVATGARGRPLGPQWEGRGRPGSRLGCVGSRCGFGSALGALGGGFRGRPEPASDHPWCALALGTELCPPACQWEMQEKRDRPQSRIPLGRCCRASLGLPGMA